MGQVILLLGGSGYLGTKVCASLLENAHTVIAPKRSEFDVLDEIYRLRQRVQVLIDASMPDVVVNLISAGQSNDRIPSDVTHHINALFPEVLLAELAERGGAIRLIHVASATEPRPGARGESLYSETKGIGTSVVEESIRRERIPGTVLRLHNVYGPDQPEGRLVRDLIAGASHRRIPTLTYPDRSRDFVFEHDAVRALTHAILNYDSRDPMVELRTGNLTTLRCLQEKITSLVWEGDPLSCLEVPKMPQTAESKSLADPYQYPLIRYRPWTADFEWTNLDRGLRTTIDHLRTSVGVACGEVCGPPNV